MEFFKKSEFNCPCCGQNQMNNDFLEQLDRARAYAQHFDKDCCVFVITSGYRCGWHNEQKGGHENSLHMKGRAADIAVKSDHHRFVIINALRWAGFTHIGIGKDFIHVDNSEKQAIWIY